MRSIGKPDNAPFDFEPVLVEMQEGHPMPMTDENYDAQATLDRNEKMLPIIAERRKNRVRLEDRYEKELPIEMHPTPYPDDKTKHRIRQYLKMTALAPFAKCQHRDYRIAKKLDMELGVYGTGKAVHTAPRHVCSACRCRHVAGWGTRGWWYWPIESGLPEVGHYGVGPCYHHSGAYRIQSTPWNVDDYRERTLREIEAVRSAGIAPDQAGGYMVDMRKQAEVARIRADTRTALHALYKLADEVCLKLQEHRKRQETNEETISKICGVLGLPDDILDDDDRQQLIQIIQQRPLTELAQGKHVPMSDRTAIDLERGLLRDVGNAAKQSFEVHEDQYTHNDDVLMLIERFYSEAEMHLKAQAGEEAWGRFICGIKDIGRGFDTRSINVPS